MFSTGSKFFYGGAALALVAAFFYAIATGGHAVGMASLTGAISLGYKGPVGDQLGYGMLVAAAGVFLFLGGVASALRDGDPEAQQQVAGLDDVPAVEVPTGTSYWPVLGALGVGVTALGLIVKSPLFVFGLILMGVVALEWTVRAWSDRATGDPVANRVARNRMLNPIEIPLLAALGIALFVLSVSRVLLTLPEKASYFVFGGVPAVVFLVAVLLSSRPGLGKTVLTALMVLGAMVVLAGGIAGLVHGQRHVEGDKHGPHKFHLKGQSLGPIGGTVTVRGGAVR